MDYEKAEALKDRVIALLMQGSVALPQFILDRWQKSEQYDPNSIVSTTKAGDEADAFVAAKARLGRNLGAVLGAIVTLPVMFVMDYYQPDNTAHDNPIIFWVFVAFFVLIGAGMSAMLGWSSGESWAKRKIEYNEKYCAYLGARRKLEQLIEPVSEFLNSWSYLDQEGHPERSLEDLLQLSQEEAERIAEAILDDGAYYVLSLEADNENVPSDMWAKEYGQLKDWFKTDFNAMKALGLIGADKTYGPYYDRAREQLAKEGEAA